MPHSSGQQMAAWSPAATPSRVWPSMMRAVRLTTDTSANRPATRPAPTAGPWMHEITRLPHDPQTSGVAVDHLVDQLEAAAGREGLPRPLEQGHVGVRVAVDG